MPLISEKQYTDDGYTPILNNYAFIILQMRYW